MCIRDSNKNRTVGEIRAILSKNGGNMGENGCVSWIFEKKGLLIVKDDVMDEDALLELALEAGAEDMQNTGGQFEITTSLENFETVHETLKEKNVPLEYAEITAIPSNTVPVDESNGRAVLKLMELLEDHDDVQKAYSNFDIPDEVMASIGENA